MEVNIWLIVAQMCLTVVLTVGVAWLSFYYNKKLKDLETQQKEKDRLFQVKGPFLQHSLEVLAESYHLAHKLNVALNTFSVTDEKGKQWVAGEVRQAREYWEKNMLFLPPELRKKIIPLTNYVGASLGTSDVAQLTMSKAFEKLSEMFENIVEEFDAFVKRYGLFE